METLSPIKLPNVSDVVYDILRQKIISGEFSPGEQLNLRRLERLLDVSRTPLKSALARLQIEGLVAVHPRRGTYVTQFDRHDVEECFELRIALEAQALRHAFEERNAALRERILDLLDRMAPYFAEEGKYQEQVTEYMDYDRLLHVNLVALSHNQRLQQAYEHANVQGYIAIMGSRFHFSDVQSTQREHRAIAAALHAGELPSLLDAARAHLEGAMERALKRIFEQGQAAS